MTEVKNLAYDLVIGKSSLAKDNPTVVAGIEFSEYPTICALAEKTGSSFLASISNIFQDQSFQLNDLEQAREQLFAMLHHELDSLQKALVFKMIATVCFALHEKKPLFGVAD